MDDATRGRIAELHAGVLQIVQQYCYDNGTSLIRAGAPIRFVVELGRDVVLNDVARSNLVDGIRRTARKDLPGVPSIGVEIAPGNGLSGWDYRVVPPTGPTKPVSPGGSHSAAPGHVDLPPVPEPVDGTTDPTLARNESTTVHLGAGYSPNPPMPAPAPDLPDSLPPFESTHAGGMRPSGDFVRFLFGAHDDPSQLHWTFRIDYQWAWIPVGRELRRRESRPRSRTWGMELENLDAIPRGALVSVCWRRERNYLVRHRYRPEWEVLLDEAALGVHQPVPLPSDGELNYRPAGSGHGSVVRFEVRGAR